MKLESIILNDFFEILNRIDANYCIMNNYVDMPEIIPSDVDIAIDRETYAVLDSLVMYLAKRHNVSITQKIWHGYNKCAYILSPLNIDKYFWFQLDFFVDFSGKGFPNLLPNEFMQNKKKKYKNFFIPAPEVEVPFILQRRIFKGDMKEEHVCTLVNLYNQNKHDVRKSIISTFGLHAGKLLIEFLESNDINIFIKNFKIFRKQLQKISSLNTSIGYRMKYIYFQFIRAVYRLSFPTGISIVVMGDDLEKQKKFIDLLDAKIAGSYHGTAYLSPKNIFLYLYNLPYLYWSKVSKKKVFININTNNKFFSIWFKHKFSKKLDILQDINIYYYNSKNATVEDYLKEYTFLILKKQSERTKRHLLNQFSPTAERRVKL